MLGPGDGPGAAGVLGNTPEWYFEEARCRDGNEPRRHTPAGSPSRDEYGGSGVEMGGVNLALVYHSTKRVSIKGGGHWSTAYTCAQPRTKRLAHLQPAPPGNELPQAFRDEPKTID